MRIMYLLNIFIIFVLFFCVFSSTNIILSETLKYEAPDDCRWWVRDTNSHTEEVALLCNLRSVNSEFDTTNFSVIPSDHTTSLKIECSSEIQSKSTLNDASFAHLIRLRELILEYCKFVRWPSSALIGLRDLRNLTIRTHNMDWQSLSLDLSPESFYPVKQLERLDLSTNNIWSLPDSVFCPLNTLIFLNISSNRLQDVTDLGFKEKNMPPQPLVSYEDSPVEPTVNNNHQNCNVNVRILDASYNHFVLLPNNGFSLLKHLEELILHDNEISMIADHALGGLKNLKILNLSCNKIVSLPLDLFLECANSIREISLENNSISILSPRLFVNLNQLLSLDLSFNQLTSAWINNDTFSGLIRLVSLNLSHNRISTLDPTLFHDLYTLQILNLEYNLLEIIPADTFKALNNLHTLTLSYNRLKYVELYSLNGLYAVSLLSFDNNKLEFIHPDALKNCTSLTDLNLNGNKFTAIPLALKEMRLLKTLDLGENLITSLEKPSFVGMNNLCGLRLIANLITTITKKTFVELPSLQILNLSQNKIKTIEKGSFYKNTKLEAIRLDNNFLSSIDGLFNQVESLIWLNISTNKLENFDYKDFPKTLQWLDVHGNKIKKLENTEKKKISLQTFDASFNKLSEISSASIPDSVEILFLNDNQIQSIEPHTFLNKLNLIRVDLYTNIISELEISALQLTKIDANRTLPEFYMAGNPIICDCKMEWLQRINNLDIRQHPIIIDLDNVYCKLTPHNAIDSYIPLIEAKSWQFLCKYQTHCYTLCQCCVFDACDCEMNCPVNCTCYHDQTWNTNIVDCASSNYTKLPNKVPMDVTELYIDGNYLKQLSNHSFIGRKNLKTLFANNSQIEVIYNSTFSGIGKLQSLYLQDNKIKILSGFEFSTLINLKELYLQNNEISSIDNRTFMNLKIIEILRIDGNKIENIDLWEFRNNPSLRQIYISNNPLSCQCYFIQQLRMWIKENYSKIMKIDEITCWNKNTTHNLSKYLIGDSSFNNTSSCSSVFGFVFDNHANSIETYLPFLMLIFVIFTISLVLVICIFLYKKQLRICLYSRCGLRWCYKKSNLNDEYENDRLFDAYVAYCIKDEDFVTEILCSNLERSQVPYRLCLHYRDFNVNSYVSDTIIEAAESSKRTILVLSKNFLQTEWCRFEYKSALREVLRDRRSKPIFIIFGEIPQKDLDPDLRLYLKINTCIQWGDNLFWPKLKYSMPAVKQASFIINSRDNLYATPANSYYDNITLPSARNHWASKDPIPQHDPSRQRQTYSGVHPWS